MAEEVEGPRVPYKQDVTFKEVPRGAPGTGPSAGPRGSIGSVELPAPLSGSTTPGGWSPPAAARPLAEPTAGSFTAGNIRNLVPVTRPGQNLVPGPSPGTLGVATPAGGPGSFTAGNLRSPLIEPLPAPTGGPVPPGQALWHEQPGASFQLGQGSALPSAGPKLKAVPGKVQTRLTGKGIDVVQAQAAKEAAQDAAYGGAGQVKARVKKQPSAGDLLDEATARGYKKAVEKRVKGVAEQNVVTQNRLGNLRAVEKAVSREGKRAPVGARDAVAAITGGGLGALVGGPVGAGTGSLMLPTVIRALTQPGIGSKAAIAAHHAAPYVQPTGSGISRLLAALWNTQAPPEE